MMPPLTKPPRGAAQMERRIGPGRLVLVAGPSGAGKDTLLEGARLRCSGPNIVFPRRAVTRPSSPWEDHDTLSDAAFDEAQASGMFALWWNAHHLRYGISASIDDDIRAGRVVACNVSRTVIPLARARYDRCEFVLVTAPPAVLAQRIAQRGRSSDGLSEDRLNRPDEANCDPDVRIENVALPEDAIEALVRILRSGSGGVRQPA